MNRQTAIIFYLLGAYVILQFAWWGYHLIDLTAEIEPEEKTLAKKIFMIFSEGMVFFVILIFGLLRIKNSIKKELKLKQYQNNFLLSVTHELKTPLAAIKLYLQTVQKRELEENKKKEIISKALEENKRLEKMIDNILNASRLENNVFQPHNELIILNDLLTNIQERYNKSLQKDLIQLQIDQKIANEGDVFIFETIITNLIDNAIKYAGIEMPITIFALKKENNLVFGVKDLGNGIPPEYREEIFKKFVRIGNEETRTEKGTGLGLFIVAEFVRLLGGKIKYIENNPKGSIFEITFIR